MAVLHSEACTDFTFGFEDGTSDLALERTHHAFAVPSHVPDTCKGLVNRTRAMTRTPRRRQLGRATCPLSNAAPFMRMPTASLPSENKNFAEPSSPRPRRRSRRRRSRKEATCPHSHRLQCGAVFAAAAPCSKRAQYTPTGLCFSTEPALLAPQANTLSPAIHRRHTGTTRSHSEARIPGTKTARQRLKPNSWASPFDALNWRPFSGPRNMTNRLPVWPAALLTGLQRTKVNTLRKILADHLYVH